MKKYYLLCILILLYGCQFEVSPWSTDVNCPESVSINHNISLLRELELSEGDRDSYKVALLSDPQMYPGAFEDVIKRINNMNDVSFILLSGDLAETGIKIEFEWACKAMAKSSKPIFAVIGNHDALSFGKEVWLKAFGEYDYSFTYQNSKFVAYNDNKYEFDNVPDRDWLQAEAADQFGDRSYTFAVSHIPPWESDLVLSQQLKDYGFDLSIHGHEHDFDFWQLVDVMLPHYVTSFTKEGEYGLLSISSSELVLENCKYSNCSVATPRTVN